LGSLPWQTLRIAQCPPQFVHRRIQAMLEIHEGPVAPDLLAQLLARDHLAGTGQQRQQNLEGLTGQTDTIPVLAQFARRGIHFKRPECHRS
jgi:hypothetical protein